MATHLSLFIDTRRKKKNNTYPISFKIIHNRIPTTINTGYSVELKYWNEKNLMVKKGSKSITNPTQFNSFIKTREAEFLSEILSLEADGLLPTMSVSELKKRLIRSGKNTKTISFKVYTDQLFKKLVKQNKVTTATSIRNTARFIIKNNDGNDLRFAQISPAFLKKIERVYMTDVKHHYNGLASYMRYLRSIYSRAIADDIAKTENYPFRRYSHETGKYKIRIEKTKKRAISKDVIMQIENYKASSTAEQRSINYFLFSFYCRGMNMVDIARLKKSNIENGVLQYRRSKTSKTYELKLIDKAKEILKFFDFDEKRENDFVFPILQRISDPELLNMDIRNAIKSTNKYLKKIGLDLGLNFKLTTYVSRHSWATIADKAGIDRRIISQGLGHADLRTTDIYIDDIVSSDDLSAADEIITG